jgi:hypothetical protein
LDEDTKWRTGLSIKCEHIVIEIARNKQLLGGLCDPWQQGQHADQSKDPH